MLDFFLLSVPCFRNIFHLSLCSKNSSRPLSNRLYLVTPAVLGVGGESGRYLNAEF